MESDRAPHAGGNRSVSAADVAHRAPSRRQAVAGGVAVIAASALLTGCSGRPRRLQASRSDADDQPRTDPALVKYAQGETIRCSVASPAGIAIGPSGVLWIAGDGALVRRLADGSEARYRFTGQASCVAAGKNRAYVGIDDHIVEVTVGGGQARIWPSLGPKSVVTCIAVGNDGLFIADAGERRIISVSADRTVHGYLCEKDADRGYSGLIVPSPHLDVAVASDGSVHVANPGKHLIEVYEPDGSPRWSWGEETQEMAGFCGCCNPTDFALMADGRYVTAEKGIPRVKVYTKDGHFDCVVAGPEALSPGVVGLDVAAFADERIAVLDPGISAVRVFVPKEAERA